MTDAVARLRGLADATAATVVAAFGRLPSGDDSPEDLARLDAIIDAVVAGQEAAQAASERAGIEMTPITPAEQEAPELPEVVAPTTAYLRQRIRDLGTDGTLDAFLARWAASGLPQTLADNGADVILDAEAHRAIERLITEHEKPADPTIAAGLIDAVKALTPGARFAVDARMRAHGIPAAVLSSPSTVGRAWLLAKIIEDVSAEQAATVAATLGPVVDGRVVTTPVADGSELAATPPEKGSVADLLAWVGDDADRAGRLLDREIAKTNPRKGLVSKLVSLAGREGSPSTPETSGPPAAPIVDEGTSPSSAAVPAEAPSSDAPPVVESTALAGTAPSLQSSLFRATPVSEWGDLTRQAYFSRLAEELDVAARIARELAKA